MIDRYSCRFLITILFCWNFYHKPWKSLINFWRICFLSSPKKIFNSIKFLPTQVISCHCIFLLRIILITACFLHFERSATHLSNFFRVWINTWTNWFHRVDNCSLVGLLSRIFQRSFPRHLQDVNSQL